MKDTMTVRELRQRSKENLIKIYGKEFIDSYCEWLKYHSQSFPKYDDTLETSLQNYCSYKKIEYKGIREKSYLIESVNETNIVLRDRDSRIKINRNDLTNLITELQEISKNE